MTFQRINTTDQDVQIIQDNISKALTPIENSPLIGGVVLRNITITSGVDNFIPHTLNRFPQIYFVGIPNVNTTIWSPVSTFLNGNNVNAQYINLRASTTCVVNVWIN